MCWSRATPTTCRCIARRRSWRARASGSAARCWPAGPARRRARSCLSCAACGRSRWARRGCSPTKPPCRRSIPAVAGPGRATPGRARAMTGPGAAPTRRRWCATTPRAAVPSARRTCRVAIAAPCHATATGPAGRWPRRAAASRWRPAGRTLAGSSSGWRKAGRRRSRRRRRSGPLPSARSGRRCAASRPTSAAPSARGAADPRRRPVRLVLGTACPPAWQQPDRGGHPLPAGPSRGPGAVPR